MWTVNSLGDVLDDEGCDDEHCTLREAIQDATSGDMIVFANHLNGSIALEFDKLVIIDKNLSIEGDHRITIDGGSQSRVLELQNAVVELARLTLVNGNHAVRGGAMFIGAGAEVSLDHVTVSASTADDGGGIFAQGTLRLINSTIEDNLAGNRGGGIFTTGRLEITTSTVSGNHAGTLGGGIHNTGAVIANGGLIVDNHAVSGGGIYSATQAGEPPIEATLDLTATTVTVNTASAAGAGIYNAGRLVLTSSLLVYNGELDPDNPFGPGGGGLFNVTDATIILSRIEGNRARNGAGVQNAGTLTIRETTIAGNAAMSPFIGVGGGIFNIGPLLLIASTISGNVAGTGAGLYNSPDAFSHGYAVVERSTISSNHADELGGAIFNTGDLALRSVTITNNEADQGGAYWLLGGIHDVTAGNSIIAGNRARVSPECNGLFVSSGHNLVAGPCLSGAQASDVVITPAQVFTEVLNEELEENGGPTRTHALYATGLAVDAGFCPNETADQRGFTRAVDIAAIDNAAAGGCDIGPYELQGPVAVVADLMISQAVDKTSVKQGDLLTYFVRVQNLGPQTAPNVVVNEVLSSGVTFVGARANKGNFTNPPSGEAGTVTWYVGEMLNGDNEVAEIEVTVLVRGTTTITSTATVDGDVVDPNEANNTAAITVSVVVGTSGPGGGTGGGNGGGNGKGKGAGPKN